MDITLDQLLEHTPVRLTPEMEQFATDVALKASRYIFTTRQGRQQFGYCTHCRQMFETKGLRQGQRVKCLSCGSKCFVRASGKGRKRLVDEAYFVYYLKSAADPTAVVAIGTYAVRDYSGDYHDVQTQYATKAIYLFKAGEAGVMFRRYLWYRFWSDDDDNAFISGDCVKARTVRSELNRDHIAYICSTYSRESLAKAIAGTPFQYSAWEHYDYQDMTEFMDLYARYPCVEYLTKMGLKRLVLAKLQGERTYGAIHWRGNNPFKVLRLTKTDLREIAASGISVDYEFLRLMQAGQKDGSKFTPNEVQQLVSEQITDGLMSMRHYGPLRKIVRYLTRQIQLAGEVEVEGCHHARPPLLDSLASIYRFWHDYLSDCEKLGWDLTAERVVFPKNLHYSHQRSIEQRRELEQRLREVEAAERAQRRAEDNRRQDEAIRRRLPQLAGMQFEHDGLLIRPIASREELVVEGKELHHCVGSYAEQYATGRTVLLAIRQVDEPDKPFYTMEVFKGRITQCYGLHNRRADERVQAFADEFIKARLIAKEQEVAN